MYKTSTCQWLLQSEAVCTCAHCCCNQEKKSQSTAFVRKLSNCFHFYKLLWTYNAYMYDKKTCIRCISSTEACSRHVAERVWGNHEHCVWSVLTAQQICWRIRGLNPTFHGWDWTTIPDQYWNTGDNKALFCSDIWENSHYCMSSIEIFTVCGSMQRYCRCSYETAGTTALSLFPL